MVEEVSIEQTLSLHTFNPAIKRNYPHRLGKYETMFLQIFSHYPKPDFTKPDAQYLKKLSFSEKSGIYRGLFAKGRTHNLEGCLEFGNYCIQAAAYFREHFMDIKVIRSGLDFI